MLLVWCQTLIFFSLSLVPPTVHQVLVQGTEYMPHLSQPLPLAGGVPLLKIEYPDSEHLLKRETFDFHNII